jgi:hypothetical protein
MFCIINLRTRTLIVNRKGAPILVSNAIAAYNLALTGQEMAGTEWASLPWDADTRRWNSPARLPHELAPWLEQTTV